MSNNKFSPVPLNATEVEKIYYESITTPTSDFDPGFIELQEKINVLNLTPPLKSIINAMLEEQFALKKERVLREKEQKDISKISESRAKILKSISDIITDYERYYVKNKVVDLESPQIKSIFRMLLDIVTLSLEAVNITNDQKKLFFNELTKNLDGWEERIKKELSK